MLNGNKNKICLFCDHISCMINNGTTQLIKQRILARMNQLHNVLHFITTAQEILKSRRCPYYLNQPAEFPEMVIACVRNPALGGGGSY